MTSKADSNLALKNYLEALDLGDRAPGTIRRAIQILYQTQQYNEADERLRWLEKQHVPFSRDLIQICAEVALQRQDYDRALAMARKVAAGDSKDYQEQIWLGQMLSILGSRIKADGRDKEAAQLFGDAETALRRAVKLEPKLTATWTGLIRHYVLAGETDKAKKAIEEAGKNIPPKDAPMAHCPVLRPDGNDRRGGEEIRGGVGGGASRPCRHPRGGRFLLPQPQAGQGRTPAAEDHRRHGEGRDAGRGLGAAATGPDLCDARHLSEPQEGGATDRAEPRRRGELHRRPPNSGAIVRLRPRPAQARGGDRHVRGHDPETIGHAERSLLAGADLPGDGRVEEGQRPAPQVSWPSPTRSPAI